MDTTAKLQLAKAIAAAKSDPFGGKVLLPLEVAERIAARYEASDEMLEALKVTMQHGRIDDSEARMNLVASAIAKAERAQP